MLDVVFFVATVLVVVAVAFFVLRMRTNAYVLKSRKALEEHERRLRARLGNSE